MNHINFIHYRLVEAQALKKLFLAHAALGLLLIISLIILSFNTMKLQYTKEEITTSQQQHQLEQTSNMKNKLSLRKQRRLIASLQLIEQSFITQKNLVDSLNYLIQQKNPGNIISTINIEGNTLSITGKTHQESLLKQLETSLKPYKINQFRLTDYTQTGNESTYTLRGQYETAQ